MVSGAWIGNCLTGPYRRQASSHRDCTAFRTCDKPVGAGLPAIGPVQPCRIRNDAPGKPWCTSSAPWQNWR
ncbi:hypothetical protein CVV67_29105 [Arthrobacter stackebrandtii]|nr:hypothetical protein CVV67_29105 [Arthrobacter stackebrandtii]